MLVRSAKWDRDLDKELCRRGEVGQPSVVVVYRAVTPERLANVDVLLRTLDESLPAFRFAAEGLDLAGVPGLKAMPEGTVSATGVAHYGLYRVTRFQHVELYWTPSREERTRLDDSWRSLFDALVAIAESPTDVLDPVVVERYDDAGT
jgi:hypothetical protein